ncbi:zinc carboxypeptidase A 1 precursor [Ophiocordyceps camponoti-floridani]|uniref:Zinc carboxypeptidase A 1 n=1 Tax=Ophiocordyceps camponoti-floridani TaxID=2030778 RepID=A0A8H4Q2Q9_9HYPO|nr:zinc carboxypeptidase A 1 precursor [Ophiocordyceps camponoti-floridani]
MKPQIIFLTTLAVIVHSCSHDEELDSTVHEPSTDENITCVRYLPVGRGDRFQNSTPRGIGSTSNFQARSLLSVTEIESALIGLQKAYPEKMKLSTSGIKTHQGRDIHVVSLGSRRPRVFIVSGIHGRDRGGPDNVVYFMADLLWADRNNASLWYESREYSVEQVRRVLDAGVVVMPSANPDGLNHDQKTASCWRKNRRPAMTSKEIGVDINANFKVFWDFERIFHRNTTKIALSRDPRRQNYVGPGPMSEPETQSIYKVFREVDSLTWYLDVHSVRGEVLYSWGDDATQVHDSRMNFLNASFHHQRGLLDDSYREYLEPEDYNLQKSAAERMVSAMNTVGDSAFYKASEASSLYPSPGSADEAMAGYYGGNCGANRINALRLDFGAEVDTLVCQDFFYPDAYKYRQNLLQSSVGLMEFGLNAGEGGGKVFRCEGA